ncbi:extracellular calcium-sensing receptor-like [Pleurodeles waltl]|uniref:extracellular calcium-sensing receptor-like n=1 Tax=Pleurodeles waltl TaxID=8319 RepID=UPI0037096766
MRLRTLQYDTKHTSIMKYRSRIKSIRTGLKAPYHMYNDGFHVRYYRDVLAMVFAVEEINQNPDLLPNITLGFEIYDSCTSQIKAIGALLELLSGTQSSVPGYTCNSGPMPAGLVGEILSSTSVPLARILGLYRFPQISYGSVLPALSDKLQFPSFLRTLPSITLHNIALARLTGHFGWTWLGMIISDDDVGWQGGQDLKRVIEENGGCVAFTEKVHLSYGRDKLLQIINMAQRHAVKVIVVHSCEVHFKNLIGFFAAQNVTDKVFVFTASFTMTLGLFPKQTWRLFNGSLGLAPHYAKILGFEEFIAHLNPLKDPNDIFIKLLWEKVFNCKWPQSMKTESKNGVATEIISTSCSENQTFDKHDIFVFELFDLSYTYHTYLAVYAIADALTSLMSCIPGRGPFVDGACADANNIQPWQVLHYVRAVNVSMPNGDELYFDSNGDALLSYDIFNVQIFNNDDIRLINVGSFDSQEGEAVNINTDLILWADNSQVPHSVCSEKCLPGYRKAVKEGKPVCCFECLLCSEGEVTDPGADECIKCPADQWSNEKHDQCIEKKVEFLSYEEPLGLTLAVTASLLTFITAAVLCVFIKYRGTPIVKANNRGLSYLLLVALLLCFLCSFIFIGSPKKLTCMLQQTVFGVIFTLSVSAVLAKTIVVVIAFRATNPNSSARKWLGSKTPSYIIFSGSIVQVLICAAWMLTSPPFPELNFSSYTEKIIFECNEGNTIFFYFMLGYMGLLATVSFIVAFLSRNLPGSFNEAKLITFSMLVFVSVWISFIPAYLSTRGKYMVAVEVFAILCSSAGLLGCIFIPKCYIMLLRPEVNTREHLVGKTSYSSKQSTLSSKQTR